MNGFQATIDGINAQWQKERTDTQMTLGDLIKTLSGLDSLALIDEITNPHSYRGYYCDLAFERGTGRMRAADALKMCNSCMGKVFEGYKGGDFVMGELTPVWITYEGNIGVRIMGIKSDGTILTAEEDLA